MAGPTINVSVLADTRPLRSAFGGLGKALGLDKLGKAVKGVGLAVGAAAIAAGFGAAKIGSDLIAAGEAASTSNARITQIATSMNLFGKETGAVSKRVADLSDNIARQTGTDQNAIKLSAAKLLTFKELGKTANQMGGLFDRATKATVDMAAAGFGSAEQNAVQLGKALNDPIKGITALARSGVTFTEAEKKKITALVQSNKLSEAQGIILSAVESQVGGTAAATANASDRIKVAWSQTKEHLGQKLLPAFEAAATWIVDTAIPAFTALASQAADYLGPALSQAGDWIQTTLIPALSDIAGWAQQHILPALSELADYTTGTLIPALSDIVQWVIDAQAWLLPLAAAIGGMVLGWKAWITIVGIWNAVVKIAAAVQAALNAVMAANPIGLVVVAIAGLIALIVALYNSNDTARQVIDAAWAAIKKAVSVVVDAVVAYVQWVIRAWRSVIQTATAVASSVVGAWNRLKQGTTDAIKAVIDWFTRLPGQIWTAVTSIPGKMAQLGRDMISGLVGALSPTRVIEKIQSVIGDALGWAKRMLGISSPSRVFRAYGRWTSEGLALGIGDRASTVTSAVRQLGHGMALAAPSRLPLPALPQIHHRPPVQIVVQALTPSIEVGRAVAQALDDYRRGGGRI